jgi:hypothetical protein
VATEQNNTALEFETMLRRHLKHGGGPIVACSGFDIDAANAYLEGALGESTHLRYEAHLAGCPSCRRQMIELSRLSVAVNSALSAAPAPVADSRWMFISRSAGAALARFKASIDPTNWRWDWRIAGAAAMACSVLAATLVVQPWRRTSQPAQSMSDSAAAPVAAQVVQSDPAEPSPLPTPPADGFNPAGVIDQFSAARRDERAAAVPMPPKQIGPATISPAAGNAQESLTAFSQPIQGRQILPPPLPSTNQQSKAIVVDLAAAPPGMQGPLRRDADAPAETAQLNLASDPVVAPRIAPSSDDNPMRSIALRERRSEARTRSEKSSSPDARPGWYDRVMGFMPAREAEKQADKQPVQDDETVSPLTRKFRDKSFRFDRGMWVDQAYKPELMVWRVVRISLKSKEYERLLAAEPQLKEYSSLGPMIIVWGDKVYRITGQ